MSYSKDSNIDYLSDNLYYDSDSYDDLYEYDFVDFRDTRWNSISDVRAYEGKIKEKILLKQENLKVLYY